MEAHLKCAVDAMAGARLAIDRAANRCVAGKHGALVLRALVAASDALRAADFLLHNALSQYQGSIAPKAKVDEQ